MRSVLPRCLILMTMVALQCGVVSGCQAPASVPASRDWTRHAGQPAPPVLNARQVVAVDSSTTALSEPDDVEELGAALSVAFLSVPDARPSPRCWQCTNLVPFTLQQRRDRLNV